MKKSKLVIEYKNEGALLGMVSQVKEYKLAWALNQLLNVKLVKSPDIEIEFIGNKNLLISNYSFEREFEVLRLLKNKSDNNLNENLSYLLPELKEFDYFLLIHSEDPCSGSLLILDKIKELSLINFVKVIEVENLKSKENLIF